MIIAPLLIRNSNAIVKLVKFDKSEQSIHRVKEEEVRKQTAHIHHHTLILWLRSCGPDHCPLLNSGKQGFCSPLMMTLCNVHEAGLAGDPVFFGDCRKLELLMAVGLERASQVVICIDRPENALKILQAIRQQVTSGTCIGSYKG